MQMCGSRDDPGKSHLTTRRNLGELQVILEPTQIKSSIFN